MLLRLAGLLPVDLLVASRSYPIEDILPFDLLASAAMAPSPTVTAESALLLLALDVSSSALLFPSSDFSSSMSPVIPSRPSAPSCLRFEVEFSFWLLSFSVFASPVFYERFEARGVIMSVPLITVFPTPALAYGDSCYPDAGPTGVLRTGVVIGPVGFFAAVVETAAYVF